MTDHFVDKLVTDLKPTKPLKNTGLWTHCFVCLFLVVVFILGTLGLREDYIVAMQTGAMFWKPALFFFIWLSSIFLIIDLSRPTGILKPIHILPMILGFVILIWQLFIQINQSSFHTLIQNLYDRTAMICLPTIFIGGGMTMFLAWKYWLSKTASSNPTMLGILSGFNAGCLAATAYTLHCNKDSALYISIYYFIPILGLSIIGLIAGRKYLNW